MRGFPAAGYDRSVVVGRLIKFGFVGTFCAGVSYAVFIAGVKLGLHYLAANALSWIAGVGLGFVLNRAITFQMPDWAHWGRQLAMFMTGSFAQLVLSTLGLAFLMGVLGLGATPAWLLNTGFWAAAMFLYLHVVFPGRGRAV